MQPDTYAIVQREGVDILWSLDHACRAAKHAYIAEFLRSETTEWKNAPNLADSLTELKRQVAADDLSARVTEGVFVVKSKGADKMRDNPLDAVIPRFSVSGPQGDLNSAISSAFRKTDYIPVIAMGDPDIASRKYSIDIKSPTALRAILEFISRKYGVCFTIILARLDTSSEGKHGSAAISLSFLSRPDSVKPQRNVGPVGK
jgi:hypothetical protein